MIIDFHVHPVSLALVDDPRHRKFMQRSAQCLAPSSAIELLLERMDHGRIERACLLGPTHGDGIALTNEDVKSMVDAYPRVTAAARRKSSERTRRACSGCDTRNVAIGRKLSSF